MLRQDTSHAPYKRQSALRARQDASPLAWDALPGHESAAGSHESAWHGPGNASIARQDAAYESTEQIRAAIARYLELRCPLSAGVLAARALIRRLCRLAGCLNAEDVSERGS